MSHTPYFFLERKNRNTKNEPYEPQHPLAPARFDYTDENEKTIAAGTFVPAELFPYNGAHETFSILCGDSDYPPMKGIKIGLPADTCSYIKEKYEKTARSSVKHFTYADLLVYLLENPKVKDYDAFWEDDNPVMCDNPLFHLKSRVDAFMEVMDEFDWDEYYSDIRIVFWIN